MFCIRVLECDFVLPIKNTASSKHSYIHPSFISSSNSLLYPYNSSNVLDKLPSDLPFPVELARVSSVGGGIQQHHQHHHHGQTPPRPIGVGGGDTLNQTAGGNNNSGQSVNRLLPMGTGKGAVSNSNGGGGNGIARVNVDYSKVNIEHQRPLSAEPLPKAQYPSPFPPSPKHPPSAIRMPVVAYSPSSGGGIVQAGGGGVGMMVTMKGGNNNNTNNSNNNNIYTKKATFNNNDTQPSLTRQSSNASSVCTNASFTNTRIRLGICAMDKKARSKPMSEILKRLDSSTFESVFFGDDIILNEPVDNWPICDVLIAFYSNGYPLEKAEQYVSLRQPYLLNDLKMQRELFILFFDIIF